MSEPCKCHKSFASVIPMHTGHCCFYPETQTCHEAEVAAWVQENETRSK